MAPSKSASRHRSTDSVGRSQTFVKPVIPLPHARRQAAAKASAASAGVTESTSNENVASPRSEQSSDTPVSPAQAEDHREVDATPVASRAEAVKPVNGASHANHPTTTSFAVPGASSDSAPSPYSHAQGVPDVKKGSTPSNDGLEVDNSRHNANMNSTTQGYLNGASGKEESQMGEPQYRNASRVPVDSSPYGYQLPPAFHPSTKPTRNNPGENVEMPHPQMGYNAPPSRIHQNHASSGSLHFGTFHESASSSPAPPHSGGIMPPPGMRFPNGRQAHMGPPGHGFPPGLPNAGTPPNIDVYGRPLPVHDAYVPSHSYRESLSSTHADENAMFPQDGRPFIAGPAGDARSRQYYGGPSGPRPGPMMGHHATPSNVASQGDDRGQFTDFLQHHFSNATFADCEIQLQHHDQPGVATIPAHRLILSRSPVLNDLMKAAEKSLPQTMILRIHGKWASMDACYLALQHLYGHPLFAPPPNRLVESDGLQQMGSSSDRIKFALAYAAAGHLIGCEPVLRRGCEISAGLVDLETMEVALEFALEGFRDMGVYDDFKYQDGSRIILHSIVSCLAANIPQGFTLDTMSDKHAPYTRLPIIALPPSPAVNDTASPVIARGHSGAHLRNSSRSHAGIQFGDLSLASGENNAPFATPRVSQQCPVAFSVISRVLLNLPFAHIKMFLDTLPMAAPGNVPYIEFGYRIMDEVIRERERRRVQILQAVIRDPAPENEHIRACLQSPEPRSPGQWSVLGWQEEFEYLNGSPQQRPRLNRRWSPLMMRESNGPVAAYP